MRLWWYAWLGTILCKSVHGFDVIMLTSFVTDTRTDAQHFYVFQTFGVVQKWIKLHQNSRSRQTHANHARWIYLTTVLNKIGESEVYEKIFIVYGFPSEMYFSHHNCTCLRIPESLATRVGFGDEWWEIHLTWKTIQNTFSRILYTLTLL